MHHVILHLAITSNRIASKFTNRSAIRESILNSASVGLPICPRGERQTPVDNRCRSRVEYPEHVLLVLPRDDDRHDRVNAQGKEEGKMEIELESCGAARESTRWGEVGDRD